MARHYSTRDFFRQMPNALLARYFQARGLFGDFVYVLHCFQKKSKRGAQTPPVDVALIKSRLRLAEADYQARKEAK